MRFLLTTAVLLALVAAAPARQPTSDDARRLAARIDEHIDAALKKAGVKPAALTDDAAFYRRASLDISGKIPAVSDVRKFLGEKSPEKRIRAVEGLLDSPGYGNHMANLWLALLLPEAGSDFQARYMLPTMQRWLRNHFAENAGYDKLAHELVSMEIPKDQNLNTFNRFYQGDKPSPIPFYFAKKAKGDDMAASVARVFMGVRLECAQCHDHPFGKWKREEFWSQAAFFAGFKPSTQDFFFGPLTEAGDRRELAIPNTDKVAQARFLDGTNPKWKFKVGARTVLADWMTSKENPFFAKAMVNRVWALYFGVGLVDPVDDLVEDNEPSHPELLDLLAKEFAESGFDVKFLIKSITLTNAYQRVSTIEDGKENPRLLGHMPLKGLTAEQLFDSLCMATGVRENLTMQQRVFGFNSQRTAFTEKFADQEKKTEYHTSIPQALTMMNNQLITTATDPDKGVVLGAVVASSFMSNAEKVEALFLAALSRKPTAKEAKKFLDYVDRGGVSKSEKKALADVFWVLLNSTEFKFNH